MSLTAVSFHELSFRTSSASLPPSLLLPVGARVRERRPSSPPFSSGTQIPPSLLIIVSITHPSLPPSSARPPLFLSRPKLLDALPLLLLYSLSFFSSPRLCLRVRLSAACLLPHLLVSSSSRPVIGISQMFSDYFYLVPVIPQDFFPSSSFLER